MNEDQERFQRNADKIGEIIIKIKEQADATDDDKELEALGKKLEYFEDYKRHLEFWRDYDYKQK